MEFLLAGEADGFSANEKKKVNGKTKKKKLDDLVTLFLTFRQP